jgi:hypothetical protein
VHNFESEIRRIKRFEARRSAALLLPKSASGGNFFLFCNGLLTFRQAAVSIPLVIVNQTQAKEDNMQRTFMIFLAIALMLVKVSVLAQVTAVPPLMNFQGRLTRPDGTPVANGDHTLTFKLYSAASGGTSLWSHTLLTTVRNGTFAVLLGGASGTKTGPLNSALFTGDRWLEIQIGNAPPLTPRQPIVTVGYAMKADRVNDGSITASSLANNAVTSAKIADGTITSADIANGTIIAADLASGALNPLAWLLGGNSGTTSSHFLGTTDNRPLELRVNNRRALRSSYAENTANGGDEYRSINMLGGADINEIGTGLVGATIGGGGWDAFTNIDVPNRVLGDFGTVGGGFGNTAGESTFHHSAATVAGGERNTASGTQATVGGGESNTASGHRATVAGGYSNTASEYTATVAGGFGNRALSSYANVGGGENNIARGGAATVPGGRENTAAGHVSFAAGYRAKANHNHAFVWADGVPTDFASTKDNQFLIRATGGVGINTNTPGFPLTFPNVEGDKISLWGQSGNYYGFGIANSTLQIHTAGSGDVIDFGYGRYGAFNRTARIHGSGDFEAKRDIFAGMNVFAQGYFETSDARYKQNIHTLDSALDTVLNLRGVSFDWNRESWREKHFREGKQIGFIAQEVEKVLPELVHTDKDGYRSVAYQNVVPVLVEAVKTLKAQKDTEVSALKADNAAIKAENAELKARLDALAAAVAELKAERK